MKHTVILLTAFLLCNCGGGNKPPVQPPAVVDPCVEQGIVCSDFFAFDEGAVKLSYAELIAQWKQSKELYIAGRPGLTPEEIQRVRDVKLGSLFIVHGRTPVAWRHITARDGHETDIALMNWPPPEIATPVVQVQANFTDTPFQWIDYGNPYALPCEYFHFFELLLRGGVLRAPEYATPEAMSVYQIIGHCTPDDPMSSCCWSGEAYSVPAGR